MRFNKTPWPLATFKNYQKQINPDPIYQRDFVWREEQKQLLVDSIIRRIDIPKIYLRETATDTKPRFRFEIIDGKQRMAAIWDYLDDKFSLPEDSEPITLDMGDVHSIAGKKYSQLPTDVQIERVNNYSIDAVIISQAGDEDIADLFYRLNHGSPLSTSEIRNSITGSMSQKIADFSKHKFFTKVSFADRRYSHQQNMAQLMYLEINRGPGELKDKYLTKMYMDNKKSVKKVYSDNCKRNLDYMNKIFPDKSRLLKKFQVINVFLLISYLFENKRIAGKSLKDFYQWYIESEPERLKRKDYIDAIQSGVNSKDKILTRFQNILLDYNSHFKDTNISLDPKRIFDSSDKIQIYANSKGKCQNKSCNKSIDETAWHADHIVPWIKGGKTIIANAQALCIKCNLSKKDSMW